LYAGCTSGIGANYESFEDPNVAQYGQGPWAHWTYDASSSTFTGTNGWRKDDLGTGSTGTGPTNNAPSFDGANYLYCETSAQYGLTANLNSDCVDLSNFSGPQFVAGYHMSGATMGVLNINVSTDGGGTWVTEWTASGDQGLNWLEAIVDLTAYAGQLIQVQMSYTSGTSFTGDCAIDKLEFREAPTCAEPTNLSATNLTTTSVDLSWVNGGNASSFNIEYGTAGFTPGTGMIVSATNPYNLTGLTPSTTYDFYVIGVCGPGDSSATVGPQTFQLQILHVN
jgi:hypothetical protein